MGVAFAGAYPTNATATGEGVPRSSRGMLNDGYPALRRRVRLGLGDGNAVGSPATPDAHVIPSAVMETASWAVTIIWSSKRIPIIASTCSSSRVMALSAVEGVASPLGWLCATIIATAFNASARCTTTRTCTVAPSIVPENRRSTANRRCLLSRKATSKCSRNSLPSRSRKSWPATRGSVIASPCSAALLSTMRSARKIARSSRTHVGEGTAAILDLAMIVPRLNGCGRRGRVPLTPGRAASGFARFCADESHAERLS